MCYTRPSVKPNGEQSPSSEKLKWYEHVIGLACLVFAGYLYFEGLKFIFS